MIKWNLDFSKYEHEGIEDNLKLFIVHMKIIEDFRTCHDVANLAKKILKTI